jgi:hypothetical protein
LRFRAEKENDKAFVALIDSARSDFERHFYATYGVQHPDNAIRTESSASQGSAFSLQSFFDHEDDPGDATDELQRYMKTPRASWKSKDDYPLLWWSRNEQNFPNVARFARDVLCILGKSSSR